MVIGRAACGRGDQQAIAAKTVDALDTIHANAQLGGLGRLAQERYLIDSNGGFMLPRRRHTLDLKGMERDVLGMFKALDKVVGVVIVT